MRMVTKGCTRLVFLIGRWAIKIPRFDYGWAQGLRGLLANLQEAEFYPIDNRMCPVLFCLPGGWLIIMNRCIPITDDQWLSVIDACPGEWLPIPVEMKRDSFGDLNGRIVAVDYGS